MKKEIIVTTALAGSILVGAKNQTVQADTIPANDNNKTTEVNTPVANDKQTAQVNVDTAKENQAKA